MSIPKSCKECGYLKSDDQVKCTNVDADHAPDFTQDTMFEMCPLKEDVLPSTRFETTYRGERLYVLISYKDSKPWEVFASYAISHDPDLTYAMASWDAITRLISLALRTNTTTKVVHQLQRSSRKSGDLPDILSKLLMKAEVIASDMKLATNSQ